MSSIANDLVSTSSSWLLIWFAQRGSLVFAQDVAIAWDFQEGSNISVKNSSAAVHWHPRCLASFLSLLICCESTDCAAFAFQSNVKGGRWESEVLFYVPGDRFQQLYKMNTFPKLIEMYLHLVCRERVSSSADFIGGSAVKAFNGATSINSH